MSNTRPNDSKTYSPKASELTRDWYVVDAQGLALGRLSSAIAKVLIGKNKPNYTPHLDNGDFVIVINAEKTKLSGNKEQDKLYYRHSGQPGHLKKESAGQLRTRRPAKLVEMAVWGMLPKNRLGRHLLRKLKVYAGPDHPHTAQRPAVLAVGQ